MQQKKVRFAKRIAKTDVHGPETQKMSKNKMCDIETRSTLNKRVRENGTLIQVSDRPGKPGKLRELLNASGKLGKPGKLREFCLRAIILILLEGNYFELGLAMPQRQSYYITLLYLL